VTTLTTNGNSVTKFLLTKHTKHGSGLDMRSISIIRRSLINQPLQLTDVRQKKPWSFLHKY
jgi:hypothetical protein